MNQFTDDDLILHRYGELEPERAAELAAALGADAELAARDRALGRALAAADAVSPPKTPPDIAARTWAAIESRLEPRRPARGRNWHLPAGLAAALALVAVSFQLGRQSVEHPTVPPTVASTPAPTVADAQPFPAAARERVLVSQVAHHLEGSQRLFTTVANAPAGSGSLEAERRWARELLATHRTYRKAADVQGQKRIVSLLDAMEPMLLELANSPDDLSPAELKSLQKRIDEGDLVFRAKSANRALAPNRNPLLGIQHANDTAM